MTELYRPEELNVDSRGIIEFLDDMKAQRLHLHKLMILRHGKTIVRTNFEPWKLEDKHMLFSLTKSFTSTAVGFAVQDGLLKTDDKLVDFFPEYLTNEPCDYMRQLTVKHLLTMNTGHDIEPERKGDYWERDFVRTYIAHEPGTHFLYNTSGSFMLSAIVQKVTGKNTVDYLKEKLFIPLGMSGDIWSEESPTGVPTGGHGLNVRIDDIAKLGQFYLQKGKWNGEQILNEQWIQDAQTPWSDNSKWVGTPDWNAGYGYQFWMCTPENVFRGDGAFGQYCIVCPDQDMVIAINSGVQDMGEILSSLWKYVLPAVDREGGAGNALDERLKEADVPTDWEENGETAEAPVAAPAFEGSYRLNPDNPLQLTQLDFADSSACITDALGRRIEFALNKDSWLHSSLTPSLPGEQGYMDEVAVRAARIGEELVIHLCYTSTPFEDVLKISFSEHGIVIRGKRNAGFGEDGTYEIIGVKG